MLVAGHHRAWYTVHGIFRLIADLIAFIAAVCATWWRRRKERIALAWPSVEGQIQSGSTAILPDSSSYSATLEYSYFLGEYRSGEYSEVFGSEDDAMEFIRAMKNRKVQIHYNPSKPDDSIFEPTDAEKTYITTPPEPIEKVAKLSW